MHSRGAATLLDPRDDVAMALCDLPAATAVTVASGAQSYAVRTHERIPVGHKFAVRAMGAGRRVRKYGEFIGRLTSDVPAGAWIHDHNLVTNARRSGDDERAWRAQSAPANAVDVLGTTASGTGDNPVFDAISGKVYWLDRCASTLAEIAVHDGTQRQWSLPDEPQGVVLARAGGLIVLASRGLMHFDPVTGTTHRIGDATPPPASRWTGTHCDTHGRLWCGATHPHAAASTDALYMIDPSGHAKAQLDGLASPCGIATNTAGTVLYFAEATRGILHACAIDEATGALGTPRPFADLAAMPGELGGAALDAEDHLWITLVDTGCLLRLAPDGTVTRVIRLPVARPTACAFGGEGLRRLFVTTARADLPARRSEPEPMAGHLLAIDVDVAGAPMQRADFPLVTAAPA